MGVSLETETLAAKSAAYQYTSGDGNYQQRHQLLPIHAGKITPNPTHATRDFQLPLAISWDANSKICSFEPEPTKNTNRHESNNERLRFRVIRINSCSLVVYEFRLRSFHLVWSIPSPTRSLFYFGTARPETQPTVSFRPGSGPKPRTPSPWVLHVGDYSWPDRG